MNELCATLCLMLTANADTLLLAAGWTLSGRTLSTSAAMLLAFVTSLLTGGSLLIGQHMGKLFPLFLAERGAAVLLTAMGLWTLLHVLHGEEPVLHTPEPDTFKDTLTLAAVLAANNIGIGIAGGASGLSPLTGGGVNFLACLLCLCVGSRLGGCCAPCCSGRLADVLSGVLLVVLGLVSL